VVIAGTLYFGAKLVIEGSLSVGELVAFNMLSARVSMPVLRLAQMWQDFHQTRISVARLGDILNTAPEPSFRPGRAALPAIRGKVTFQHVTFRYRVDTSEVLSDVSFEVSPGQVVGIVGSSGTDAERDHLKSDLVAAELEVARLRAALGGRTDPLEDFRPPEGASPSLIEMNRQFLISQTTEHQAKIAALDRQIAQKEAERDTIAVAIGKLEATIPILAERVEVRKLLYDKALGSKLTYLTEYQDLVGQRQDLLLQKSKVHEADAAIAALVQTRAQTAAEYRRTRFEELTKAEQKAAGVAQDVIKAEQRTKLQALAAPVDGVVQQLAVHTVGGVVTPAQALLVVVPLDTHLEIEAMVSNRDIGFVHADQEAEIKVDTFSFTRYGLLHGQVLSVSQDAIARDKPQDNSNGKSPGAESSTSEPKGQQLNYTARVSLDRTQMQVEDKFVNLSPGMAVTVEIKTGSRRIISYLLSPLLRYKQEVLRER
jgi:hemolysin D